MQAAAEAKVRCKPGVPDHSVQTLLWPDSCAEVGTGWGGVRALHTEDVLTGQLMLK